MSERDGNQEVYVMNADGSGVTRLTDDPGVDGNPTWSPDGNRVAFATTRYAGGEDYDIAVMNPDGSGVQRLTTDTGIDVRPIWSPDGQEIMYSHRVAQGNYDVWILAVDGSRVRELLTGADNEQGDAWGMISAGSFSLVVRNAYRR
jgi:TolB protein